MEEQSQTIEEILRRESLSRITDYNHPEIVLKHEPINPKQCQELQKQLRDLIHQKIDQVAKEYQAIKADNKYDQVYSQFVRMTITNETYQKAVCSDIKEMHEMADILMHPPPFGKDLYLNFKELPQPAEVEQFDKLYKEYEKLYKSGYEQQSNQAQLAIQRAKRYILRQ